MEASERMHKESDTFMEDDAFNNSWKKHKQSQTNKSSDATNESVWFK